MKPDREKSLNPTPSDTNRLRQHAEEALKTQPTLSDAVLSHEKAIALVHELQVHQIELEMQNEELAQTREEAETLRDQYIDLYDFAPVGYVTLDPAGIIQEVNLTGSLLLSMNRGALIGARFGAFLHLDSRLPFTAFCERVRRTGITETCDLKMQGPAGDRVWYAHLDGRVKQAGPNSDGRIRLAFSDVTENRRANEAAAESELRFRRLFETMLQGVVYQNADGRIISMNPAAERILGKSPAEFINQTSEDTEHHTIREDGTKFLGLEHPAMVALRTGEDIKDVVMGVFNPREQGYRWISIDAVPLFHPSEKRPYQVYTIFDDITERRKAEEVLREYGEKVQASNEELQQFAYVTSHDLQEPLRNIVSFSQLLNRRYQGRLDADADEYLGFIIEGGQRMQLLIKDLLQFSQVQTTARPLEQVDMHGVVADVLRMMERQIREANATVTMGDLPAIMADASQLEQVFTNLIGNALKYRRHDLPPAIQISAERMRKCWRFAVADNGIGIAPEFFDRIFVVFQRLHTIEEFEGTGIGLAIVKKIVERHGGRVSVTSVPGEGSTFFFTLPAVEIRARSRNV
ncbi:sensor histidine kinase [Methanosphaerula palustris]|uniref:histidine kinase n=1 Tax=Methanosphaerula palustris (strain ATCC BAA-1556 / DSM 19958 / E1-9c) TaxID=521011 RepID=B8GEN7_METPE|nr:PAS domain-containing sensor histidine kinase [Methanosphaerula palustris]ACL17738.1 PAS/PAC sensor signal transduction histidine kinase [Methanosphaerula palustris E1-9c]